MEFKSENIAWLERFCRQKVGSSENNNIHTYIHIHVAMSGVHARIDRWMTLSSSTASAILMVYIKRLPLASVINVDCISLSYREMKLETITG